MATSINYDKKQYGFAAKLPETCDGNVWEIELEKDYKRGIKISYWIAGVRPGRSGGSIHLSRKCLDGKCEKIGYWSDRDGKWKVLNLASKEEIETKSLRSFSKRTITVKDLEAGKYKLSFDFIGGNSAAAIKKIEIKKA